jgi:TonB family protein
VWRLARLLDRKVTQLKVNRFVLGASVAAFGFLAILLQTPNGLVSVTDATSLATRISPTSANDVTSPGTRVAVNLSRCNHDATVVHAVRPNISKADFKPNASANALVTVGADGRVDGAKIVKSSGSTAIDHATLEAATHSTYASATKACKAIAGEYMFHVQTGPEPPEK